MPKSYTLTDRDNRLNRRSEQECLNILTADDFDIFSGRSGRLAYDGGSAAFNVGATVTGGTTGHTAVIYAIVGDATSGYLLVNDGSGVFQDDEAITDNGSSPGAAVANGVLGPHTDIWTGFTVIEAAVFAALTTGYEDKRNVVTHSFSANFEFVADLRSIQLTSGVIMAHKINLLGSPS